MNARQETTTSRGTLRVSEWVLGVLGGISAFLGLFILFGGDDQYVGIGGDASWRVGDISSAWGYGLLAGGIVLGLLAVTLFLWDRRLGPTETGRQRSSQADVLVHATVFVLVNAFLWIQDIVIGDGLNYAYWVTIPWGIGLVAHAITAFGTGTHRPVAH